MTVDIKIDLILEAYEKFSIDGIVNFFDGYPDKYELNFSDQTLKLYIPRDLSDNSNCNSCAVALNDDDETAGVRTTRCIEEIVRQEILPEIHELVKESLMAMGIII